MLHTTAHVFSVTHELLGYSRPPHAPTAADVWSPSFAPGPEVSAAGTLPRVGAGTRPARLS